MDDCRDDALVLASGALACCTLEATPTSTPTSTPASIETLSFDAFSSICCLLSTLDLLACGCCK